jgi:Ca2+-binding EF-hand superfamily protein
MQTSSRREEDLRRLFNEYDINNDGVLSESDLKIALRRFGRDVHADEVKRIIQQAVNLQQAVLII